MEPDAVEMRVLGCLIEKQRTTPDVYPLTLNSLRLACNQSTNRDPVVDYDEGIIRGALDRLVQRKWATLASWANRRTMKYRHTLDRSWGSTTGRCSLLAVLMLRGPQTPGELRARTERLHRFEDAAELDGDARAADRARAGGGRRAPAGSARGALSAVARGTGGRGPDAGAPADAPPACVPAARACVRRSRAAARRRRPAPAAAADERLAARIERLERDVAELREGAQRAARELGA